MGDGWLNNIKNPETYGECWQKIRGYAAVAGRDPDTIEPGLYVTIAAGDNNAIFEGQTFLARYYNRSYEAVAKAMLCLTGSWEEVVERIEAFRKAGARTIVVRLAAGDQLGTMEACARALSRRGLLN